MINFIKNKKELKNLFKDYDLDSLFNSRNGTKEDQIKFRENLIKVSSWRDTKNNIQLSPLFKENLENLTKILKNKYLGSKILGSEKLITKIWLLKVNENIYVLFYNKNGLSIEGDISLPLKTLNKDIKEIISYMRGN